MNMWNRGNKELAVNSVHKSNQIYDPLHSQNLISVMLRDGNLSSRENNISCKI